MYAEINHTRIYFEVMGKGAAPILLCHGNGADHSVFDRLAEALAPHFTVFLPDSRGHGRSAPADPLHYADMAEDMAALIRLLELEKPAFYGFSDGGIVGLLLASRHPAALSRLAVSGANITPDGLSREFLADMRRADAQNPDPKIKMMLTEPHMTEAELALIRVPTLVMAGENDLIRPEHTRRIAAAIPGAELKIIPGEDHGSYVEHSTKVYDAMKDFLLRRT